MWCVSVSRCKCIENSRTTDSFPSMPMGVSARGVSVWGGVCLGGVYQTPSLWTESQTLVKTLTCCKYIVEGNKEPLRQSYVRHANVWCNHTSCVLYRNRDWNRNQNIGGNYVSAAIPVQVQCERLYIKIQAIQSQPLSRFRRQPVWLYHKSYCVSGSP